MNRQSADVTAVTRLAALGNVPSTAFGCSSDHATRVIVAIASQYGRYGSRESPAISAVRASRIVRRSPWRLLNLRYSLSHEPSPLAGRQRSRPRLRPDETVHRSIRATVGSGRGRGDS